MDSQLVPRILTIKEHLMTSISDRLNEDDKKEIEEIAEKTETRVIGKIIKLSEDGWGFISSKDIKFTRIFFHWTSLKQNTLNFTMLKIGMKVSFTPVEIPDKGFRAIKIEVVELVEMNMQNKKGKSHD